MWPGWRSALPPVCCYFWLYNMKTVLTIFTRIKTAYTGFPCILIHPTVSHIRRGTCFPAGKQLPLDFPQLEKVASIYSAQGNQVTILDENSHQPQAKFKEEGLFFAEPQFFDIFHFPFIAGNPKTALSSPNTVVLTQEAAKKYFGDWRKAIGRLIRCQDNKVCTITGILKDPPVNSDFPFTGSYIF